jgi:hypothetical protein
VERHLTNTSSILWKKYTFVAEVESNTDSAVLEPACGDARGGAALVRGIDKAVLPPANRR